MHEGMENHLSEKLVKFVNSPPKNHRGFLYGIAPNKLVQSHMLKLAVPHQVVRTISKEYAEMLLRTTTNMRDYFLLYLLFETGMRIGEALSLWLEDIDISRCTIHICDRGELAVSGFQRFPFCKPEDRNEVLLSFRHEKEMDNCKQHVPPLWACRKKYGGMSGNISGGEL